MLLRLSVPFLEISSAGATQLHPRLSLFTRVLLTQPNRAYSSPKEVPVDGHTLSGNRYKQNGSRRSERPGTLLKLLDPYDLSSRVDALCEHGKLSEAISTVKEAPLDAQNTIVWATLIRSVIGIGKYQEAYRLFIDVSHPTCFTTSLSISVCR